MLGPLKSCPKWGRSSLAPIALCGLLAFVSLASAEDLKVLPESLDGTPPSQMLHEYLMGKAHAAIDVKTG